MRFITWNVQWGRGIDGRVDLARIVGDARRIADFDVLCLQEVTRGFHLGERAGGLAGEPSADQFAELAGLLPGFTVLDAIGSDLAPLQDGAPRRQFGNAIASRLPIGQVIRHSLPWPADPAKPSMQRVALEAMLDSDAGPIRVITTHLEFYSESQRLAQVDALRGTHLEACGHAAHPGQAERPDSPFENTARPLSALVCGDFNCAFDSPAYRKMLAPLTDAPSFVDAWTVAHPHEARAPTVGLYDRAQWPDGPLAFDFVFVTEDLAPRVARCDVDVDSSASDHQPVALELR
jgi:endonuclease/exonuclease/phosphatase family metal-dependent hydrolase